MKLVAAQQVTNTIPILQVLQANDTLLGILVVVGPVMTFHFVILVKNVRLEGQ